MAERQDRWLFPFTLAADERDLVVTVDGGTATTITMPDKVYYAGVGGSSSSGFTLDGMPSALRPYTPFAFFEVLHQELASTFGVVIPLNAKDTFSPATPTDYGVEGATVQWKVDGASTITLNFSNAGWQLPPKYLGFPDDQTTDVASTDEGDSNTITPPISNYGKWRSHNIIDGQATRKYKWPARETRMSTKSMTKRTRNVTVDEDDDVRTVLYEAVSGLHIFGGDKRKGDAGYAATAEMATGDGNNAFLDLWRANVTTGPVIVIHDDGDTSMDVEDANREIVTLHENSDRMDPESFITERRTSAELHDIDAAWFIYDSGYDY